MQINIEIPSGYEIDSFDKVTGKVTLKSKPREVTERIKTVEDVLADNGLTKDQFDRMCINLEPDEVAYRILKMLVKSLNEGCTPNWKNSNEYKYYPYFEMDGSSGFRFDDIVAWSSTSRAGS